MTSPCFPDVIKNQSSRQFCALDSLRGICACMVVLLHFRTRGLISNNPVVLNGYLFVDFFFVLSGFVISAAYGQRLSNKYSILNFMFLRWGRIYPLHFVMLFIFVLFESAFALYAPNMANRVPFTSPNEPGSIFSSLFLIQIFVGPDGTPWNGPSWSIAAEFWAYLVFAFAFRWTRGFLIFFCLIISAICCLILCFLTDRYLNVFHTGAIERCLYGFAIGVISYRIYCSDISQSFGKISFASATALEIANFAIVATAIAMLGRGPWTLVMPLLFASNILLFSQERGFVSKILMTSPFIFLGTLSYSIYMVHGFIYYRMLNLLAFAAKFAHFSLTVNINGGNEVGGSPAFGDVMSVVMLAVTISVAWMTYNLIERPGRDWTRRQKFSSPRPADTPTQSTVPESRQ